MSETNPEYDGSEIALCGMACRFPEAPDLGSFWRNLREGRESIRFFEREELERAGEDPRLLDDPQYVPARPVLAGVELFDAAFFGFSPREASMLDPQHRLFLECSFEALEDAGFDSEGFSGPIALYAGASFSNYLVRNLYHNRPVMEAFGDFETTIHNVPDSLATLVGYKLNLKGACCAVQTFCSTSLVAVHMACQSLLGLECDMALAGGATVYAPQHSGYLFQEGGIVSPDGHCRAFDARGAGTVFGSGVGVVVLRRLRDALADGAHVDAIIRGSAVNNDGSLKVSFAAPGVAGQTAVIAEALAASGVEPDTIGMVEAHGTGTRLGDPAEVAALTKAFRPQTQRRGFCALGSVKTNVGHLDAAAGVAGLIKLVLSLQHKQIPASLHFETPNPEIELETSPFYVSTRLHDWPAADTPRRGGVSAFGVGGTNAHVIVEEAPPRSRRPGAARRQLVPLSARTDTALDAAARRLADHLEAHPELELADVAYTQQLGRRAFDRRRVIVAASAAEAVAALRASGGVPAAVPERRNAPIVAVLAGAEALPEDGSTLGAWSSLLQQQAAFRAAFERCSTAAGAAGRRLHDALELAASDPEAGGRALAEPATSALFAFALGQALVAQLTAWGLRFEAFAGQGAGELSAACLAGALGLETATADLLERQAGEGDRPGATHGTAAVLSALSQDEARLVVELGPAGVRVADARLASTSPRGEAAPGEAGLLRALGELWQSGVDPDWRALHTPGVQRVRLPTYPFERERHWVEPLDDDPEPVREPASWLYRPLWKPAWPTPPVGEPGATLVFLDSAGLGHAVAERLRAGGAPVTEVAAGLGFSGDADSGYVIDPGSREDYRRLFDSLRRSGRTPRRVLHLWALEPLPAAQAPAERFRRASELGFYSLQHMVAAGLPQPLTVHLATSGLDEVIGGESLGPEHATLPALARVVSQESPGLRCVVVDLEPGAGAQLADQLALELGREQPEAHLALRRGRRFVQEFEPIPAPAASAWESRVRPGGTFLITGGLGDVGSSLAWWLARQGKANLVLTGRRELPARALWPELLQSPETEPALGLRIRRLLALEAAGGQVVYLAGDVADREHLQQAVRLCRERFLALDGVVHAAGELAAETFAPVAELDRAECERQFGPKVRGTLALAEALAGERPAFCLLTSSLSSVLGGSGYGAYAAANAFQDAFAAAATRAGATPWLSLDFDHWSFDGKQTNDLGRRAAQQGAAMAPTEALVVVEHALRLRELSRVVVSTAPLAARLELLALHQRPATVTEPPSLEPIEAALRALPAVRSAAVVARETELVAFVSFGAEAEPTVSELRQALRARLPAESLPRSFVVLDALPTTADGGLDRGALLRLAGGNPAEIGAREPRTPTERLVAGLWTEALGVERVRLHDNFFDLGGHSLLSIRVLARIEKATGLRLDPRDLIFQSLEQLAASCDERLAAAGREATAVAS